MISTNIIHNKRTSIGLVMSKVFVWKHKVRRGKSKSSLGCFDPELEVHVVAIKDQDGDIDGRSVVCWEIALVMLNGVDISCLASAPQYGFIHLLYEELATNNLIDDVFGNEDSELLKFTFDKKSFKNQYFVSAGGNKRQAVSCEFTLFKSAATSHHFNACYYPKIHQIWVNGEPVLGNPAFSFDAQEDYHSELWSKLYINADRQYKYTETKIEALQAA